MSILPRDDFVTSVLYIVVSQSTFQSFLIGRAALIDVVVFSHVVVFSLTLRIFPVPGGSVSRCFSNGSSQVKLVDSLV